MRAAVLVVVSAGCGRLDVRLSDFATFDDSEEDRQDRVGPPPSAPTSEQMANINKQKITPYLWFDNNAEQAVEHYLTLFPGSRVHKVSRWGKGSPFPEGAIMNIELELAGQRFIALNGGPHFKFTPAISLFISCDSQAEVDLLWDKIQSAGGTPSQCGWITDKFGLSWQVIPSRLDAARAPTRTLRQHGRRSVIAVVTDPAVACTLFALALPHQLAAFALARDPPQAGLAGKTPRNHRPHRPHGTGPPPAKVGKLTP